MSADERYKAAVRAGLEKISPGLERYYEVLRLERGIGSSEREARKAAAIAYLDAHRPSSQESPTT